MRGITEEMLKKKLSYFDSDDFTISGGIEENYIMELLDECQELNPWQPIETAPKDRRILLLFIKGKCSVTGSLREDQDKFNYSHWMELPEPPK